MNLTIGVTDGRMYDLYANWALAHPGEVEVIRLGYKLNNFEQVKRCRGLLLTGGEDVHPDFYNKTEYLEYFYKNDVDKARDAFELELLHYAVQREMPVLGICRGLQLVNVFFGGTLIPDIPSWGKFNHEGFPGGKDRYHEVKVDTASWLHTITGADSGMVNSLHHQSTDTIGRGLVVSALSPDGVAEAIERKDKDSGAFLCLVQWHPERMTDQNSPFVSNIREAFVDAMVNV